MGRACQGNNYDVLAGDAAQYEELVQSILQRLDNMEASSKALHSHSQMHLYQMQQAVTLINNHGRLLGGLQAQVNRQTMVSAMPLRSPSVHESG